MAVVFGRASAANTNANIVDPAAGVCQFALSSTNHQTQFVAESRILAWSGIVRLKFHRKQPSKNNNSDGQKKTNKKVR